MQYIKLFLSLCGVLFCHGIAVPDSLLLWQKCILPANISQLSEQTVSTDIHETFRKNVSFY